MNTVCENRGFSKMLLILVLLSFSAAESEVGLNIQTESNNTKSFGKGRKLEYSFKKELQNHLNSCVEAQPKSDSALTSAICHRYRSSGTLDNHDVCKSTVGDELLYATPEQQERRENWFVTIRFKAGAGKQPRMPESPMKLLSKFCWGLIVHMYCRFMLPRCDLTSHRPRPQPICKEACREFKKRCQKEWTQIQKKHRSVSWRVQYYASRFKDGYSLMWCNHLPRRKGPDIPECYYPEMLNGNSKHGVEKPPISDTCFRANGQSYRGNVSITRSGYTCQAWNSQCPHRHHRTPNNFPELEHAGNACRNPGGQAPHGPWCYTTSRHKRWEYCRVEKCDQNTGKRDTKAER